MKKIGIFLIVLFSYLGVNGQAQNQLNFGIGLDSFDNSLPMYISYDFSVHEDIKVAPVAQIDLLNFNWMTIGVRSDYYFDRLLGSNSSWDFYAGVNVGFLWIFTNTISGTSDFSWGLEGGSRYWFSDKWGVNLEFGGGSSFSTKLGLSVAL